MEILILLFLLQVKHCYADFVIQTYDQTVKKGIYKDPVGISHSVDHVWTSLIVLLIYSFFVPVNLVLILFLCFAEGIIHYHIDWAKVHFGCKDNTKPLFWAQFGYDQLAHQATYLLMAAIILAG
jgi:hypothetical protein